MLTSLRLSMRRAGFSLGGAFLMMIGLAFLTVSAWITLAEIRNAQFAALVLGGVYVGLGLVVIAIGARRPYIPPPAPLSMTSLAASFAQGFGAGVAARTARKPAPR